MGWCCTEEQPTTSKEEMALHLPRERDCLNLPLPYVVQPEVLQVVKTVAVQQVGQVVAVQQVGQAVAMQLVGQTVAVQQVRQAVAVQHAGQKVATIYVPYGASSLPSWL